MSIPDATDTVCIDNGLEPNKPPHEAALLQSARHVLGQRSHTASVMVDGDTSSSSNSMGDDGSSPEEHIPVDTDYVMSIVNNLVVKEPTDLNDDDDVSLVSANAGNAEASGAFNDVSLISTKGGGSEASGEADASTANADEDNDNGDIDNYAADAAAGDDDNVDADQEDHADDSNSAAVSVDSKAAPSTTDGDDGREESDGSLAKISSVALADIGSESNHVDTFEHHVQNSSLTNFKYADRMDSDEDFVRDEGHNTATFGVSRKNMSHMSIASPVSATQSVTSASSASRPPDPGGLGNSSNQSLAKTITPTNFDLADTNHDGVLSKEELFAALSAASEQPSGPSTAAPGTSSIAPTTTGTAASSTAVTTSDATGTTAASTTAVTDRKSVV